MALDIFGAAVGYGRYSVLNYWCRELSPATAKPGRWNRGVSIMFYQKLQVMTTLIALV
jgi:hypothetical protein